MLLVGHHQHLMWQPRYNSTMSLFYLGSGLLFPATMVYPAVFKVWKVSTLISHAFRVSIQLTWHLLGVIWLSFQIFLQGILHSALHGEFWRLIDPQGKPPGVMGWWPSRAVTFLENHDTGSTQVCSSVFFSVRSLLLSERKSWEAPFLLWMKCFFKNQVLVLEQETNESAGHDIFWFHILLLQGHWPFPRDKIMMGYAYILTHPGTVRQPYIFYWWVGEHNSWAKFFIEKLTILLMTKFGIFLEGKSLLMFLWLFFSDSNDADVYCQTLTTRSFSPVSDIIVFDWSSQWYSMIIFTTLVYMTKLQSSLLWELVRVCIAGAQSRSCKPILKAMLPKLGKVLSWK
jgi:hypothetical protein